MDRYSTAEKANTFDHVVGGAFVNYDDPRMMRRLRRRYGAAAQQFKPKTPENAPQRTVKQEPTTANRYCKPKSPGNIAKRTVQGKKQVDEIVIEPHYKKFLDSTVVLSDSGDHSVDFKYMGATSVGEVHSNEEDSDYGVILEEMRDDDNEDPDYKWFLENLREDGKSYVLQVFVGFETLELKYEEEDWMLNGVNLDTPKTLEPSLVNWKSKDKKTLRGFSNREMKSFGINFENISSREDPSSSRMGRYDMETSKEILGERRKDSIVKRNANAKQSYHVSRRRKWASNVRPDSEAIHLGQSGKNHKADSDGDESYLMFLEQLEREAEEVKSVCQSDSPLKTNEGEKTESDIEMVRPDSLLRTSEDEKTESEIEMMDQDPFGHESNTPFVTSTYFHDPVSILLLQL